MLRVRGSVLLGPKDIFAVLSRCLGPGDEDHGFFAVIAISDIVSYVRGFHMQTGIEAV